MSTRDVNAHGSFREWFLANIDAESARNLRDHGASCGIGGLCYYSETRALFHAWGEEIERLATDDYDVELWEIVRRSDARGITQTINALVWMAAERLAYVLEDELRSQEEGFISEDAETEGGTDEN